MRCALVIEVRAIPQSKYYNISMRYSESVPIRDMIICSLQTSEARQKK